MRPQRLPISQNAVDGRKGGTYIVRQHCEEVMDPVTRRSFLKKAACMTGGALLSSGPLSVLAQTSPQGSPAPEMKPDLVAVKGKDFYVSTQKAIQELGGIEAFVRKGDRVGLLVNSPFKNIGASVNP